MEDIEGILIATTNLEGSLDPAFERRFIYKVKFEIPSQESRTKMWKSMIPELDEAQAGLLAKDYSFSGGQIENIARKSAVEYVLSGEEVSMATLLKFCGEEILQSKARRGKVGF
jgi:SpoVK/Ycf46/Vps4 family AAA+-type ATPase